MVHKKTGSKTGSEPGSVGEEILRLMKSSFEASFDNVARIQELNQEVLQETVRKGKSAQEEALKTVEEFIENAKRGQEEYRKLMEEGFQRLEETLLEEE